MKRLKRLLAVIMAIICAGSIANFDVKAEGLKINEKHKKIVKTNFFDKTLLTMIITNNIMNDGNDNQFQIVRGNIYEPRREISRSIKSIKESWLSDYRTEKASFTHYIE